jgi:alpha-mannosidase
MKIPGVITLITILLYTGFPVSVKAQQLNSDISVNAVLPGYKVKITGENSSFHSSNPDVNDGMITRCNSAANAIEWTTAPVPENYNSKYVYFVWLAGLATGNNRQNSSYDFYINNKNAFNIKVNAKQAPHNFMLNGVNGASLTFVQHSLDDNKDCFGYMYLKVPVADYQKGKPLTLKIAGVNSSRYDDFIIVFQHEEKEEVTLRPRPLLRKQGNQLQQLVAIQVNHILPAYNAVLISQGESVQNLKLKPGFNEFELWSSAVKQPSKSLIKVNSPGIISFAQNISLQPVAQRELYLVNHSHNDIGYSDYQPVVAQKQNDYIRQAMKLIEKSKDYPKEARYIWNIEAMWAVENFMAQATEEEKTKLIAYAKSGSIGLPAGYANLLTGITRPEELIHLTDYSDMLHRKYGLSSKTMMISDVPGISWSIVSALAQRNVRYISSGPNYIPHEGFPDDGGRVGDTHRSWGDKPFYWVSASAKDTVLYWQAGTGYSMFQDWNTGKLRFEHKSMNLVLNYVQKLQDNNYPYEMVQMRYSIINDNQKPDDGISDVVEEWNKKYVSPKLVITNVEDMMTTFEQRYGKNIPVMAGDFTPYWEDGAMSTAKEEVLTKRSTERLYQTEVLSTLLFPGNYNEDKYYQAWKNTILWHEHTWGAWNSVSQPDEPNAIRQWVYKQNFALRADSLSRSLLDEYINPAADAKNSYNCINTSSWNRTDLVIFTKEQSSAGDIVVDEKGISYPSQRLKDGTLAFLAKDVPALGSKKFFVKKGRTAYKSDLKISENLTIENKAIKLTLDKNTGAVKSFINKSTNSEFVDGSKYQGLNQYLYMPGLDPSKALTLSDVQIKIKEAGPLVATFEIIANAPGVNGLVQEVSLVNELNKLDITDKVDKAKVRDKESVHFAFPLNVDGGKMRMDIGNAVLEPGKNQLPGANTDYISMQRWVDVSNNKEGATFITYEVPLIEEGDMVNEMPAASSNSFGGSMVEKKWNAKNTRSNTFFSYAMNNYWYTNYKADQEGPVVFHYAFYLHNEFDAALAGRTGTANAQPLLISSGNKAIEKLPFTLNDTNILLTAAKPALSKKGIVLRFYNASAQAQQLNLNLTDAKAKVYVSNAREEKLQDFDAKEAWPAYAVKTLYIEL